jgi:hypothetical protein
MIRNLKMMGMSLMAILAMSAIAAAGASAQSQMFHSDGSPTTLKSDALNAQVFSSPAGEVKCNTVTLDEASFTGETLTTITAQPTYTNCKAFIPGEVAASVDFSECDYKFTSDGPTHLECEGGGSVHIRVTAFNLNCFDVEPQEVSGVTYTNGEKEGVSDITLDANVTGLKYVEKGVCGSGETTENATYTGEVTVTGFNEGGGKTSIAWG